MEDIKCIFCNRGSDQVVIEENGYKGRKCPQCGLIFISPRPTYAEILNLYDHDQAHYSAESQISGAFMKRLFAKHNLRIIKKFIKNGSMLEIGAGAGYFLDEARKEGFEVNGIEFNNILADFVRGKLGIPCEESPLDVSLFDGKKFDIIYHRDVISHFYDPISEFQKINDKLKKNGFVVFETGNLGDVKTEYYRFYAKFEYPDHLFSFSENNLKELLGRTGFEFIEIYRYSILLQLVISKIFKKEMDSIKSEVKAKDIGKYSRTRASSSNMANFDVSGFNFKKLIIHALYYVFYVIRYKIGYVTPKIGRPQTVIVVARKRSS